MQAVLSVLARLMLVTIFVMSAVGNKIPQFSNVAQYMGSEGVPAPQVMLAGAIVFLLVGSGLVLTGFHARFGAALLAVFLVLATYYFHDFWNATGDAVQMQMIQFMKNLGLLGAMLFIIANDSGAGSLDRRSGSQVPTAG
ncbi:DoxX family membrane protein [bacterium]|nr:DoxX family membrane protein [bacterium]